MDVHTDDATIHPPNGDLVRGKKANKEFFKKLLQMGMKDIIFKTIEVEGFGDMAYEIGKELLALCGKAYNIAKERIPDLHLLLVKGPPAVSRLARASEGYKSRRLHSPSLRALRRL